MGLTYEKVATKDFSVALDTAKKVAEGTLKLDKMNGSMWSTFVAGGMEKGFFNVDSSLPVESIRDEIVDRLAKELLKSVEIPKEGKTRDGRTIELRHTKGDKKGTVKWTSWRRTKSLFAYGTDVAKVIKAGLLDKLMDGDLVAGRSGITKEATEALKVSKSPLELIKQFLDNAQGQLDNLKDAKDMDQAQDLLSAFVIVMTEKAKRL